MISSFEYGVCLAVCKPIISLSSRGSVVGSWRLRTVTRFRVIEMRMESAAPTPSLTRSTKVFGISSEDHRPGDEPAKPPLAFGAHLDASQLQPLTAEFQRGDRPLTPRLERSRHEVRETVADGGQGAAHRDLSVRLRGHQHLFGRRQPCRDL